MRLICQFFLIGLCLCFSSALAQERIPDFTRGGQIPQGHNHDWNLGPTGARGWIYSDKMETKEARQVLVTSVDKGSPADSVLKKGDVILGVGGKRFSYDPRVELGKSIGAAESSNGRLKLTTWRNGKTDTVQLQLKVLGSYTRTAPFDCQKSRHIFEDGCKALAAKMRANPNERNGIIRAYNTLALLASGNEEYLPVIREQIEWAANYSDVKGKSLCCWYYGPINLLLAEYILATGDRTYLPDLKRITMEIVDGQSAVGTWGHRFARPDGRLNGYGMMNAPGLPMTTSLILARDAGVDDPKLDVAIKKSVRLMRFYVGKGCVPYGDHAPWIQTHDDNGKNGIAALMFNLLDDQDAATYFSRMSVASHGSERENGHTGNFFNMLWALPGVALSGPEASGAWMNEFGWYYDLARKWDGTFQHQGPAQPKADRYRNWDSTGAYLLAYGQAYRHLLITGKKTGVVAPIERSLADQLITDGRGFDNRKKKSVYANRSTDQLFEALTSWSPVVRERAAMALARKKGNFASQLTALLNGSDLYSQMGACQAIKHQGSRASETVSTLQKRLQSQDLWLRVQAAEALARIGDSARVAIPDLLKLLVETDQEADPRQMTQRFVCFALFNSREGLLRRSLKGVDRVALYEAVKTLLQNEDGKARGSISRVYQQLTFEEIKILLPAIYEATAESAPSGMMFADGVRLNGLEVLAKHRIQEGMPLCLKVIEYDRWGSGKRIKKCLQALQQYQGAAKPLIPQLKELENQISQRLSRKRKLSDGDKQQLEWVKETIELISTSKDIPKLSELPNTD